jgi:hypothetical protein
MDSIRALFADRVKPWFMANVWPGLRPALYAALWAFVGTFGAQLIGFLEAIIGWFETLGGPEASEFPDPSLLGKALVSAAIASVTMLGGALVRIAQTALGKGNVPEYPND